MHLKIKDIQIDNLITSCSGRFRSYVKPFLHDSLPINNHSLNMPPPLCLSSSLLPYSVFITFDRGFTQGVASQGIVIIYDTNIKILFADGYAYNEARDAEESELRALFQALSYASHARFHRILFISDSANIVNFMLGMPGTWSV